MPSIIVASKDDVNEVKNELSKKYDTHKDGIPKTDLSSDVQSSLNKADSALQSFTETDPNVQDWAKKNSGITVEKSVPSNAKFTDTWRGIQNNLTSDSTTDSLSAAQGKVLKELIDSKEASLMTGATSDNDGSQGLVPAPSAGDQNKFLRGDGTWQEASGGSSEDCLPKTGGIVTGNVQQSGPTTDYATYKFRNIAFGTSKTPTTDAEYGGNGSIYFYYS